MGRLYYVYILASDSRELYVGATNDLCKRIARPGSEQLHRKTQTLRLVYYESTGDVLAAIRREKQIIGWTRRRKLELLEQVNPEWVDWQETSNR